MGAGAPRLRSDAQVNRDRILEVARALFATRGLDVPMAAVARRAGVGIATLYRRFPTKEALVTEVFADQFAACSAVLDDALADPDPWRGFCTAVQRVFAMQAADRGFSAAVVTAFPDALDLDRERRHALQGLDELIRRATAAGGLRPDFTVDDLVLLMTANCGIVTGAPGAAVAASRRFAGYQLDALRADRAGPLPPPVRLDLGAVMGAQAPHRTGRAR